MSTAILKAEEQLEGALARIDTLEREVEAAERRAFDAEARADLAEEQLAASSRRAVTKAAPRALGGGAFDPVAFGRHVSKAVKARLSPMEERISAVEIELRALLDLIAEREGGGTE